MRSSGSVRNDLREWRLRSISKKRGQCMKEEQEKWGMHEICEEKMERKEFDEEK
jgi:hypothetical protein